MTLQRIIDVNIEYSIDDTQNQRLGQIPSTISDLRSIRVLIQNILINIYRKRNADELLIKP